MGSTRSLLDSAACAWADKEHSDRRRVEEGAHQCGATLLSLVQKSPKFPKISWFSRNQLTFQPLCTVVCSIGDSLTMSFCQMSMLENHHLIRAGCQWLSVLIGIFWQKGSPPVRIQHSGGDRHTNMACVSMSICQFFCSVRLVEKKNN